jgi:hypothetical protein
MRCDSGDNRNTSHEAREDALKQIRKRMNTFVITAALVMGGVAPVMLAQTAGQDIKDAGRDTKNAAKDAGHGVAKGTKKGYEKTKEGTEKGYHKTKQGTKHVVHKTAHATAKGADKVEDKTEQHPQ